MTQEPKFVRALVAFVRRCRTKYKVMLIVVQVHANRWWLLLLLLLLLQHFMYIQSTAFAGFRRLGFSLFGAQRRVEWSHTLVLTLQGAFAAGVEVNWRAQGSGAYSNGWKLQTFKARGTVRLALGLGRN